MAPPYKIPVNKNINDGKIYIFPQQGLVNRLRTIFAYYTYATSMNKLLYIYQPVHDIHTANFNGNMVEYITPPKDMMFGELKREFDYIGCNPPADIFATAHWNEYNVYEALTLQPHLQSKINKLQSLYKDYIAIHVRRTDFVENDKGYAITSNKDFYAFCDQYHDKNIYIATDCNKTYDIFYKKYQGRILNQSNFLDIKRKARSFTRLTTVEQAIIDLYMCMQATEFKGTMWSSFSEFITYNRGVSGKTVDIMTTAEYKFKNKNTSFKK